MTERLEQLSQKPLHSSDNDSLVKSTTQYTLMSSLTQSEVPSDNQDDEVQVCGITALKENGEDSAIRHQYQPAEVKKQETWDRKSCDLSFPTFATCTRANSESLSDLISGITFEESDRHQSNSSDTLWSLSTSTMALGAEMLQQQQQVEGGTVIRTSMTSSRRFAPSLCVTMEDQLCAPPARCESLRDSRTTNREIDVEVLAPILSQDLSNLEDTIEILQGTKSDVSPTGQQQQLLAPVEIRQHHREQRDSSISLSCAHHLDVDTVSYTDKSTRSLSISTKSFSFCPHNYNDSSVSVDLAMSSGTMDTNLLWQDSISSGNISSSQSTLIPPEHSEMRFETSPLAHIHYHSKDEAYTPRPDRGPKVHPPPKHQSLPPTVSQKRLSDPLQEHVLTKLSAHSMDVVPHRPRRHTSNGRMQRAVNRIGGMFTPHQNRSTPPIVLSSIVPTTTMKDTSHTQRVSNISGSSNEYVFDSSMSSSSLSPSSVTSSSSTTTISSPGKRPSPMGQKRAALMAGSTRRSIVSKGDTLFSGSIPCPILERHEGSDDGESEESLPPPPPPTDISPTPPKRRGSDDFVTNDFAVVEGAMTTTYGEEYQEDWTTELESDREDDGCTDNVESKEFTTHQSRRPCLAQSQHSKDYGSPILPIRQDSLVVGDGEKRSMMDAILDSMVRSRSKIFDDNNDHENQIRAPVMPTRKSSGLPLPPPPSKQQQRNRERRSSRGHSSVMLCEAKSHLDASTTSGTFSSFFGQKLERLSSYQRSRSFGDAFVPPSMTYRQSAIGRAGDESPRQRRSWDGFPSPENVSLGSPLQENDNQTKREDTRTVAMIPDSGRSVYPLNGSSHRRRSYEGTMDSPTISRRHAPATTAVIEKRGKMFVEYSDEAIPRRRSFDSLAVPARRGSMSNGEESIPHTSQAVSNNLQLAVDVRSNDVSSPTSPYRKNSPYYGMENSFESSGFHDAQSVRSNETLSSGRSSSELPPVLPRRKASSSQTPSMTSTTVSSLSTTTFLPCHSTNTEASPPTIPMRKPSSYLVVEENGTLLPMTL